MKQFILSILMSISVYSFAQVGSIGNEVKFDEKDLYTIVDIMPVFPGCEMITDPKDREKCTEVQFTNLIQDKILSSKSIYPSCDGDIEITFIIKKDGTMSDIDIFNKNECKEEIIKTMKSYSISGSKWYPGSLNGNKVNVKMKFTINLDSKKLKKPKKK